MKIWKKFVLFTITIISIILSCSRYYIVKNNFLTSIENIRKSILETNIVKDIQARRRNNK